MLPLADPIPTVPNPHAHHEQRTGDAVPAPQHANGSVSDVLGWGDLTAWHPSAAWLSVVGLLAGGYLVAAILLRRRGVAWPVGRMITWLLGLVTLTAVTCTGLATFGKELNDRPRQTLKFQTPSQALAEVLR